MATLSGSSLVFKDTLENDGQMSATYDTASYEIGGVTYVYISALSGDSIHVATLSDDGTLTRIGTITDTAGTTLNGVWRLEAFEVDGVPMLAAAGSNDSGVTTYTITDTAPYLTFADAAFGTDNPDFNLTGAVDVEALTLSGGTFLYVSSRNSDGISVFSVSSTGGLTNTQNVDDGGTLELNGLSSLTAFTRGSTQYMLASSYDDNGITVFSINGSTGALTEVTSYSGSSATDLDSLYFTDTLEIDGTVYFYIPEFGGDAVSVMAFNGSSIESVQRIESDALLGSAIDAEVIDLGDRKLLAIATFSAEKLHLFEIDTTPLSSEVGTLTPLQTVEGGADEGLLDGASSIKSVTVGDKTFLLSTAHSSSVVNVHELGGGDDLIEGTNSADDLSGGGGDDTLTGFGGDDLMSGGDGGDEMDGGSGNDTMFGGAGDDDLDGGSGDDSMEGGAGADMLRGEGGADLLRGDAGSDWMDGGSGSDTLSGNDGEDTLRGGDDNDAIYGGNDGDAIAGNLGNDYLRGNNGDDAVYGGAGNDDLGGDAGNDTVEGGLGDDLMRGGADDDLLLGGRGIDTLAGNSGNDTLRGGADNDVLIGGTGTDMMYGDSGADVFVFDNVNQSIHGSARDTIADFAVGVDKVDLSGFAGTLTFVASYTGAGNEVRYSQPTGRLYLDLDGDGASDFSVDLTGNPALTAGDLIL